MFQYGYQRRVKNINHLHLVKDSKEKKNKDKTNDNFAYDLSTC